MKLGSRAPEGNAIVAARGIGAGEVSTSCLRTPCPTQPNFNQSKCKGASSAAQGKASAKGPAHGKASAKEPAQSRGSTKEKAAAKNLARIEKAVEMKAARDFQNVERALGRATEPADSTAEPRWGRCL